MDLSSISLSPASYAQALADKTAGLTDGEGGFADILRDAVGLAENTETQDRSSALGLLTGEADDVAGVLIDAQESKIALSLTIQLRNKLMESYNEIMNMQV